jgi:hypothetical protein
MNLHKYILLITTALILNGLTFAQSPHLSQLLKDGSNPYDKLWKYIRANGKTLLERECANGCFFLKFKIDPKGNIVDLVSNNWAWPSLDSLVQAALLTTNGQWVVTKKGMTSKTYFLPILYSTGNCKPISSLEEMLASIPDITDSVANVKANQKGMFSNFLHMNDFENKSNKLPRAGSSTIIECLLLPPFYLSGPVL